jgi:hypothetical protein
MADSRFEPRAFFEVLLPALLLEKGQAATALGSVIQFYLTSPEADEAWYADLSSYPPEVVAGTVESPDASLAIASHLVLPLVTGELDVTAALAAGDLELHGDAAALEGLGKLFTAGLTGMGILYASVQKRGEP